jgi:hypothetical protein
MRYRVFVTDFWSVAKTCFPLAVISNSQPVAGKAMRLICAAYLLVLLCCSATMGLRTLRSYTTPTRTPFRFVGAVSYPEESTSDRTHNTDIFILLHCIALAGKHAAVLRQAASLW